MKTTLLPILILSFAACTNPHGTGDGAPVDPYHSNPLNCGGPTADGGPVVDNTDFGPQPNADGGLNIDGCPCTRRPGRDNSYFCPQGSGASASATIGPDGAVLTLAGAQGAVSGVSFGLTVGKGTAAENTLITVTETTLPPPAGFVDESPVWELEPAGLVFSQPALMQTPWSNLQGAVPAHLAIYASDDGTTWTLLANQQGNAGFSTALLSALPKYVFVGAPHDATNAYCP